MVPCYLVSEFTGNSRLLISTCNEHERVYESKRVRTLFHATHQSYFTLHSRFYRWSSILFYVTFARATDHRLHFTSYRQICFLVVIELRVFTRVERSFPKRYQRKEQTTKDMRLNEATSIDRSTCTRKRETLSYATGEITIMLRYPSRNTRGTMAGWLTPYRRPAVVETDITCSLGSYYIIWEFLGFERQKLAIQRQRLWYRFPNTNGSLKNTLLGSTYRVQIVQIRKLMGSIVQCNILPRPPSPPPPPFPEAIVFHDGN